MNSAFLTNSSSLVGIGSCNSTSTSANRIRMGAKKTPTQNDCFKMLLLKMWLQPNELFWLHFCLIIVAHWKKLYALTIIRWCSLCFYLKNMNKNKRMTYCENTNFQHVTICMCAPKHTHTHTRVPLIRLIRPLWCLSCGSVIRPWMFWVAFLPLKHLQIKILSGPQKITSRHRRKKTS